MEILNELEHTNEVIEELLDVKMELNLEIDKEELYWEQRARANWLKMGDCNMMFFHRYASQRRQTNQIKELEKEDGSLTSNKSEMISIAKDCFLNLFKIGRGGNGGDRGRRKGMRDEREEARTKGEI
ncbi:hypothetical protein GOBAR_DD18179 [Gossypium barbadense]|nr:hypothetical protein GOBAR_DD18179 [Gossypium barbadense]